MQLSHFSSSMSLVDFDLTQLLHAHHYHQQRLNLETRANSATAPAAVASELNSLRLDDPKTRCGNITAAHVRTSTDLVPCSPLTWATSKSSNVMLVEGNQSHHGNKVSLHSSLVSINKLSARSCRVRQGEVLCTISHDISSDYVFALLNSYCCIEW